VLPVPLFQLVRKESINHIIFGNLPLEQTIDEMVKLKEAEHLGTACILKDIVLVYRWVGALPYLSIIAIDSKFKNWL
jgi:hypothetical protein